MDTKMYDAATRQNLEVNCEPFLHKLLGFPFKVIGHPLDKFQSTINREVDFVRLVEGKKQDQFILHVEFQSTNHPDMAFRMQEYYGILARKFRLSVWQFVFYYGNDAMRMEHKLSDRKNRFEYQLINLAHFDYQIFFESEAPGVVIWAVLANPGNKVPKELLKSIKKRVLGLCKDDFYMAIKCLRELKTFSNLRNLELNNTNEIEAMKLMIDVTDDVLYQDGKAEGKAQGLEQGKREVLLMLLENGLLSIEQIQDQLAIDPETIEEWTREEGN